MLNVGAVGLLIFLVLMANAVGMSFDLPLPGFHFLVIVIATYGIWGIAESALISYEMFGILALVFSLQSS